MIQLFFLDLEHASSGAFITDMLRCVSEYKKEKLMKKRFEADRIIGVYADILIRCLLSRQLGRRFEDIHIQTTETGKPYIEGSPRLDFNLSHTKTAIAAALSDKPVGIDIEKIHEISPSVPPAVCTESELAWLNAPGADPTRRFMELWTRKEALVKYDGTGLSRELKTCDTLTDRPPLRLSTLYERDYVLSVCAHEACTAAELTRLSEENLITMWRENIC